MRETHPRDPLARAKTVLLDMNGVFMSGHDRFGPGEDFFETYRRLGGRRLGRVVADAAVRDAVTHLSRLYEDRAFDTRFPRVVDVFRARFPTEEAELLAQVLAAHEIGVVTPDAARTIRVLAEHHTLVVVSNLWSDGGPWRDLFVQVGLAGCFEAVIFSSDLRINKPSPDIFRHALNVVGAGAATTVMVGDSYLRDIQPAAELGLGTVWVTDESVIPDGVGPDGVGQAIRYFSELAGIGERHL